MLYATNEIHFQNICWLKLSQRLKKLEGTLLKKGKERMDNWKEKNRVTELKIKYHMLVSMQLNNCITIHSI